MHIQGKWKIGSSTISKVTISLRETIVQSYLLQQSMPGQFWSWISRMRHFPVPPVFPFSWGLSHETILASFSEKLEYPASWSSVWWNRERTKYPDGAVSGSTDGNRRALMPCFCFQCYFFGITSLKTSTELISYTAAIGVRWAELLSIISRFIFWHVRNFSNWYL